jgi:hypothetical protein
VENPWLLLLWFLLAVFLRFCFSQWVPPPMSPIRTPPCIFGTNQLGIPMQPGAYEEAQRAPFADSGHPGLDISFQHLGCGSLTGGFVVTDATFSSNATISSFAASFEQHCGGVTPALFGTFTYNANATEVPEQAGYLLVVTGMMALSGGVAVRKLRKDHQS